MKSDFPIVCILGMHRSGTSCLTGSLQQSGLQLGKFHSWNRYNQKGNRENQDIVDFHETLLSANSASWDAPPKRLRYGDEDIAAARKLVARYSGEGPWGFKDPRALLALKLWQAAAPELQFVGIFRHPRAVAESISRRAGGRISPLQAMELWHHYNRQLYRAWKQRQFPILCFDWDEAEFHQRLEPVIEALGLTVEPEGERFYTDELRHYDTGDWSEAPWRARRLYRKLVAACDQWQDASVPGASGKHV